MMSAAWSLMGIALQRELAAWETDNLDGHSVCTSDWPGWAPLIGRRPRPEAYGLPGLDDARTRKKAPIPTDLRWEVWKRDDFRCQGCASRDNLSADHVIPESKGGPTTVDNLTTLCRSCNSRKGARL
jgi:hypothetical protein